MALVLASALGGFKSAKSAKGAKGANPWKLAPLALLGRAGDPIVAEAGGKRQQRIVHRLRRLRRGVQGQNAKDGLTRSRGDAEGRDNGAV